jgi:hypothetical protein
MAVNKIITPPQTGSGADNSFDNLVGVQLVDGGGLTSGNFTFTTSVKQKSSRTFNIGTFSEPISLDTLSVQSTEESRILLAKEFRVYPNFDLSEVTNFTIYGSLTKRLAVSITKILGYFPASIDIDQTRYDLSTGTTAFDMSYDSQDDETTMSIDASVVKNPFDVDFTTNSVNNLAAKETPTSPLRDFTTNYRKYSLYSNGVEYPITYIVPTSSISAGTLQIVVSGQSFTSTTTTDSLKIRLSTYYTEMTFSEAFDEVERFLLNRLSNPPYTATFNVPRESDDGVLYIQGQNITWPLDGFWNLDIRTSSFGDYVTTISEIAETFDNQKTNLISRFFVTESIKEFDTSDQKVEKVLQIYGRGFDEVKKFIDALAYMNNVSYNPGNDIPSALLKNLAQTLGYNINVSPISSSDFLNSVFNTSGTIQYSGYSRNLTPTELNYQFYRNLILNAAYLFKSKGTRKAIEGIMKLVGAPDFLVEFNENIYLADQKINISQFETQYAEIQTGFYEQEFPEFIVGDTYTIKGTTYSAFTSTTSLSFATESRDDYPIDIDGYPYFNATGSTFFFQKGSGWFESTPSHRSPEIVNNTLSVFSGTNPNIQTSLSPFTYGQDYLNQYRTFPNMNLGFTLRKITDNRKSWSVDDLGLRVGNQGGYNAYYNISNDKLVINVKNVDLFMNPSQGIVYDVWKMSNKYNYPIPSSGMSSPYPTPGNMDWTFVNPQPQTKSFFEFAQSFWRTMINTRNRQWITGGNTNAYPTLSQVFWNWIQSENVGVSNDNFNYQNLSDYVDGIGPYWIRMVEQFIPASTIWNTGTKFENSIFHRQKFVYRRQRGCQLVPITKAGCRAIGTLFGYDCITKTSTCSTYPTETFSAILYSTLNSYVTTLGKTLTDCITSTVSVDWYVNIQANDVNIANDKFYTTTGISDAPTNTDWKNALTNTLNTLIDDGYYYTFSTEGTTLTIRRLTCEGETINLKVNVGIDFSIFCN